MPRLPIPDPSCYLCDGGQCRIRRIVGSTWHGLMCDGADHGKECCKLFINSNKEGLILFMTKDA